MKRMLWLILFSLLLFSSSGVAQPVQWTVAEGGNGHWYEYVADWQWDWYDSLDRARGSVHEGINGELVTLTSPEEEQWVRQRVISNHFPIWIGGRCTGPPNNWYWVGGESTDYENWDGYWNTPSSNALFLNADGWGTGSAMYEENMYIVEYSTTEEVSVDPLVVDTPADHGGFLNIGWDAFPKDAAGLPDSIATYDAQRFESGTWTTLITIAAAQADSYQVTVPTPDVFTIGQPEIFSQYRVVANSIYPAMTYYSAVDSAYSIDNIAPPIPEAFIVDGHGFRNIFWNMPDIPDLGEMCVYRGTESGFVPVEPIACPEESFYVESYLGWLFYRVQFSDIHGNLSEFSDELHGQYPTGVGEVLPTVFSMEQNHPNPFNPLTTIKFSLPESAPVSLKVYDISGKLVRDLISGQMMEAGDCEKVWNGRDDRGQTVSAGVYFYRLNAGDFTDVRRMALVK